MSGVKVVWCKRRSVFNVSGGKRFWRKNSVVQKCLKKVFGVKMVGVQVVMC